MAIAGRAMAEAVGRPPLTVTAHYLSRRRPARARSRSTWCAPAGGWRRRRAACGWATPRSSGCSARSASRRRAARPYTRQAPVDLPPLRGQCRAAAVPTEGPQPAMFERLRIRLRPDDAGSAPASRPGEARSTAGSRSPTSEPIDADRSAARGRRVPAGGVQHRAAGGVGADGRADRARARRAGARARCAAVRVPLRPRRPARRGRRDLGLRRRARRPVPPAGARPAARS